jgi:hypothetical protein
MKIKCTKCGQRMVRTITSIKESARLQGITPEEYIKNYVCRSCLKRERPEPKPKPVPEPVQDNVPKSGELVMVKTCQSCANECKVYVISEKAVLSCPRYRKQTESSTT